MLSLLANAALAAAAYTFSSQAADAQYRQSVAENDVQAYRQDLEALTTEKDGLAEQVAQLSAENEALKADAQAAAAESTAQPAASAPAEDAAASQAPAAAAPAGETVYITNSGTKYHQDGCSFLSKSKIPISLDDAIAGGYEPCSRCN